MDPRYMAQYDAIQAESKYYRKDNVSLSELLEVYCDVGICDAAFRKAFIYSSPLLFESQSLLLQALFIALDEQDEELQGLLLDPYSPDSPSSSCSRDSPGEEEASGCQYIENEMLDVICDVYESKGHIFHQIEAWLNEYVYK